MKEYVVLVDELDQTIGRMEKMEAHQKGVLHRAFSVFIFNSKGEMLLQQRAFSKYHSPGLWTNTCCSHPRVDEPLMDAANRRLDEEMGMKAPLHYAFNFIYKVALDQGLYEHELDHVFYGTSDNLPKLNPDEVADYKYIDPIEIKKDLDQNPEQYTAWFKICFERVLENYQS